MSAESIAGEEAVDERLQMARELALAEAMELDALDPAGETVVVFPTCLAPWTATIRVSRSALRTRGFTCRSMRVTTLHRIWEMDDSQ